MSLLRLALHKQKRCVDLSFRKSLRFEKLSGLTQTTLHWFSERIGSSKKIASYQSVGGFQIRPTLK